MIVWQDFAPGVEDEPVDAGRAWPAAVWLLWVVALGVLVVVATVGVG